MFERFSDDARRVIVFAQDEARELRHTCIGTEHILLGLLRQEQSVAAQALAALEVTLEETRAAVGRLADGPAETADGPGRGTARQIPFTNRAKKILELALREALGLGHNYIGSEHILLGLARENDGTAMRILNDRGVRADEVRRETLSRLSPGDRRRRRRGRSVIRPRVRPHWEYRVAPFQAADSLSAESLNELGAEGWELVGIAPATLGGVLVFKRRVHRGPDEPPAEPA